MVVLPPVADFSPVRPESATSDTDFVDPVDVWAGIVSLIFVHPMLVGHPDLWRRPLSPCIIIITVGPYVIQLKDSNTKKYFGN